MAISTIGTNGLDQTSNIELGATGNVGIGTSSPSYKLDVTGSGRFTDSITAGTGNTVADLIAKSSVANGGTGYSEVLFANTSSNTRGYISYAHGNDAMVFGTVNAERMRIDSSGNLLVGTTSTNASTKFTVYQPSTTVHVGEFRNGANGYGLLFYNTANSIVGSITWGATATTYSTSSDYRLKENIQPMQNALGVVAQLKPVTYTWKADGSDGQGFIAHELQEVVPDCVTGEKDAVDAEGKPVYQGIDTSFLVATLTAAIQELNAKVESLEAQLRNK